MTTDFRRRRIPSGRAIANTRMRLLPAIIAGATASVVFFLVYYVTLGQLPSTYVALSDYHPLTAWDERFDLSQFIGTIIDPPYATETSWWIGAAVLFSSLTASAVAFGILCAWAMRYSTAQYGMAFGSLLFLFSASAVSLGSGFDPAVMRQALPDVGFFFLGWTGWATLQMLLCFVVYGWMLGRGYELLATAQRRGNMHHERDTEE